ncbi:MAG: hydrogenase maturation protease [Acidobacteriota bacterium]|nr:hydrogenase maturation protease [Acidobacteriota bacterium]
MTESAGHLLVLGIGNVLMGDEGVGVHVVRHLEQLDVPPGVELLDGGTGSFLLLDPMQRARKVILIDATLDGNPAGTVRRLTPRFSRDYPRTLTAHDIGLKDLLDTFYLLDHPMNVVLFAISIAPLQGIGMVLSPEIEARVAEFAQLVLREVESASRPDPQENGLESLASAQDDSR